MVTAKQVNVASHQRFHVVLRAFFICGEVKVDLVAFALVFVEVFYTVAARLIVLLWLASVTRLVATVVAVLEVEVNLLQGLHVAGLLTELVEVGG